MYWTKLRLFCMSLTTPQYWIQTFVHSIVPYTAAMPPNLRNGAGLGTITITMIVRWKLLFSPSTAIITLCLLYTTHPLLSLPASVSIIFIRHPHLLIIIANKISTIIQSLPSKTRFIILVHFYHYASSKTITMKKKRTSSGDQSSVQRQQSNRIIQSTNPP